MMVNSEMTAPASQSIWVLVFKIDQNEEAKSDYQHYIKHATPDGLALQRQLWRLVELGETPPRTEVLVGFPVQGPEDDYYCVARCETQRRRGGRPTLLVRAIAASVRELRAGNRRLTPLDLAECPAWSMVKGWEAAGHEVPSRFEVALPKSSDLPARSPGRLYQKLASERAISCATREDLEGARQAVWRYLREVEGRAFEIRFSVGFPSTARLKWDSDVTVYESFNEATGGAASPQEDVWNGRPNFREVAREVHPGTDGSLGNILRRIAASCERGDSSLGEFWRQRIWGRCIDLANSVSLVESARVSSEISKYRRHVRSNLRLLDSEIRQVELSCARADGRELRLLASLRQEAWAAFQYWDADLDEAQRRVYSRWGTVAVSTIVLLVLAAAFGFWLGLIPLATSGGGDVDAPTESPRATTQAKTTKSR